MKVGRLKVPVSLVYDYELREVDRPAELIVLLHGYSQSGSVAMSKFERALPVDAAILAPNGPFPRPYRRRESESSGAAGKGEYEIGFSWYFYNPSTDEYDIGMEVAIQALVGGIRKLGLEGLPKRVVGFSQGGYLAPFLARELDGVTQVVGVGARYLEEELLDGGAPIPGFRMDGVHGEADIVVDIEESEKSHGKLIAAGARGKFLRVPGTGHEIRPALVDGLAEILAR